MLGLKASYRWGFVDNRVIFSFQDWVLVLHRAFSRVTAASPILVILAISILTASQRPRSVGARFPAPSRTVRRGVPAQR